VLPCAPATPGFGEKCSLEAPQTSCRTAFQEAEEKPHIPVTVHPVFTVSKLQARVPIPPLNRSNYLALNKKISFLPESD